MLEVGGNSMRWIATGRGDRDHNNNKSSGRKGTVVEGIGRMLF